MSARSGSRISRQRSRTARSRNTGSTARSPSCSISRKKRFDEASPPPLVFPNWKTAKGGLLGKESDVTGDGAPLALEIIGDGTAKTGVGDVMGAIGLARQIAAGELMRALRPRLDAGQPVLNREVDRLVVADLEMQKGVLLDATPIAAVERIGADEVERTGDIAARPLGEHEQHLVGHAVAEQAEAFAREI